MDPSAVASDVDNAPSRTLSPHLQREASDLILEAFSRAKRSGKADWRYMTTAVLKNRLLQITSGGFELSRYCADSVRELVDQLPTLLEYAQPSGPGRPGTVVLKSEHLADESEEVTRAEAPATTRQSIRPDLWRAAMDWAEHADYVLDPATGRARQRVESDPGGLPSIQGIPKETYLSWRDEFIAETLSRELSDEERAAVATWKEHGGPSRALPRHIQDGWMSLLRSRVRAHLASWFAAQGIDAPENLDAEVGATLVKAPAVTVEVAVSVARLRETIHRCVREMTYDELRRLDIPAEVVARVVGR